jgi:uncharacterized SAM-binding protein YcdF (DUF218 family)
MNSDRNGLPVVVVPEGLAFDEGQGKALYAPSFVGEAVLRHVLAHYLGRMIFIAPANNFGEPFTEHEVMADWLKARGCPNVQTPPVMFSRYIDTWGNAVELRAWLDRRAQWPLGPIVLVAAFRHARRIHFCFRRNGYEIDRIDAVSYTVREEPIVPRLFYYRWPLLHEAYEVAALLRDGLRLTTTVSAFVRQ